MDASIASCALFMVPALERSNFKNNAIVIFIDRAISRIGEYGYQFDRKAFVVNDYFCGIPRLKDNGYFVPIFFFEGDLSRYLTLPDANYIGWTSGIGCDLKFNTLTFRVRYRFKNTEVKNHICFKK